MTLSLDHIGIFVKDLDRTISFYQNVFDFPEKHRSRSSTGVSEDVVLDANGNLLEFIQLPAAEPPKSKWTHIAFHVEDYSGIVSKLEEMGIELRKLTNSKGFGYAFFKDPDGHDIEIMEQGLSRR